MSILITKDINRILHRRLFTHSSTKPAYKKRSGREGDRTPDLVVANDALSQLSYTPVKLSVLLGRGSLRTPDLPPKADALPAELHARIYWRFYHILQRFIIHCFFSLTI